MRGLRATIAISLIGFALIVSGCDAKISISVRGDSSAVLSVNAALLPKTAALMTNLASFVSSGPSTGSLLDADALSASLAKVKGVKAVALKNPSPQSVTGTVTLSDLRLFLSSGDASAGAVRLSKDAASGVSRLQAHLDRAMAPALLERLSPELMDYLNALMAPIASGEAMSKTEYLALISSMYGEGLATELSVASVTLRMEFPGPVVTAKGGKAAGNAVDLKLSLLDVLVLEKPLDIEASWK